MGKIHELSSVLADQIAAGEVVERPASVVKELVENAVDAHAAQLDILVQESGVQSIRVIDDGDGIDDAEVLTAFKRHATSKITSREDLFRVHSLGFRGEALPSIASVADVVMNTSTGALPCWATWWAAARASRARPWRPCCNIQRPNRNSAATLSR